MGAQGPRQRGLVLHCPLHLDHIACPACQPPLQPRLSRLHIKVSGVLHITLLRGRKVTRRFQLPKVDEACARDGRNMVGGLNDIELVWLPAGRFH